MENKWLAYIKRIHALSQIGLNFTQSHYDRDRYEELLDLSLQMMQDLTEVPPEKIKLLFSEEKNYLTPKTDVRAIVFQQKQILLVQEAIDNRWCPPGGWADIGYSPAEVAVKETKEEAGLEVKPIRLLAVLDKQKQGHPPSPFYVYKLFILCEIIGGELRSGTETKGVGFFALDQLPELSQDRILHSQIALMFEFLENPEKQTVFD
ncbi:NUDIX hydrolase [Thermoflexibacter ruber]|uniref:ADP-ribose pyrophosphatase YjhB, NUDIX family n=1 Tax=Thermoflexibacter ruber TaxID=1003 RepID=A0A1I2EUF1_9BACT|nr:NUDIX hydrolase [Thermoflexibacter ruber]SFE96475.1 ADP-ribose pyrophosphatase YjhB, NUDIX family [Thermoflexibacter ruber]